MSGRSNVSSSSRSSSPGSGSEIDYCIRTTNYLISTLGLSITPLRTLNDLAVEHLLRIHCELHGIDFASDFIPSGSASEDVSRMILSLKDKYGADKFSALDAALISQKNPTQVRFVLENFHLILNHQIARASKSKQSKMLTSQSGNHLSVYRDSVSDISKADSFYVLPHQIRLAAAAAEETQETMDQNFTLKTIPEEFDDTGDSFETIENIKINVVNETTTDDDHTDVDVSSSSMNDTVPNEAKVAPSQTSPRSVSFQKGNASTPIVKKSPTPLTSSPVGPHQKLSKSHLSPNVSVIKKSQSTVSNLHRTINSTNPNNSRTRTRSTPRNVPSSTSKSFHTIKNTSQTSQKKPVVVLAKNDKFGRRPFSGLPPPTQQKHRQRTNETQFMSDSDIDNCIKVIDSDNLIQLRELQTKIRSQISESVISLDEDISNLKRKQPLPPPPQSKVKAKAQQGKILKPSASQTGSYFPTNIPNLRWLLPVDARFPSYHKGVIIPKCTSLRSKIKKSTTRPLKTSAAYEKCMDLATRKYSTLAERGSEITEKQLELSEDDSLDG